MSARMPKDRLYALQPVLRQSLGALGKAAEEVGLEPLLIELVKLRASQINGCAFCLHMHAADARKLGEKQERLDVLDARIDFHDLFIGLPKPGSLIPRLYCKELGLKLKVGEAFEADGLVDFLNDEEIIPGGPKASGFRGQGRISIQGLPTLEVSFAFLRVTTDGVNYARAWFVYAQVSKLSLEIPIVELFIREIGFGLGYRYTLAMIQATDEIQDPKKLLKTLTELSRTQGNLSSFDQWRIDYTGPIFCSRSCASGWWDGPTR